MEKIKIGIPKALLYYKYKVLWKTFFEKLDCIVLTSPDTDINILEIGKKYAVSESCLSLKIFIGHVSYLVDKVDYILVPRIVSLERGKKLCTNFSALYDIVNNTFDTKILDYNIDVDIGNEEEDAFMLLGKKICNNKSKIEEAYKIAKREEYKQNKIDYLLEQEKLKSSKIKILLVSHSYNSYDKYIGKNISYILKELNCEIIYADRINQNCDKNLYKNISKTLYWSYNIDLLNMIEEYKDKVNGMIILSTFPCGPDSLVNEMIIRKINIPTLPILMDDITSSEGMQTRLESFIDILGGNYD